MAEDENAGNGYRAMSDFFNIFFPAMDSTLTDTFAIP